MSIQVANTSSNLTGKTVMAAENAETVTGLKTFDRDPSAPFAVTASSAVVPNLDADKLDGLEATVFARWDGGGTPLGQIAFPATQNPSAGANVLDDYEEGTFTPTITSSGGGTPTYSSQVGVYTKVGRMVTVHIDITLATKGTLAAGFAAIASLPFAAIAGLLSAGSVGYSTGWTTNIASAGCYVNASASTIGLTHIPAAGATAHSFTTVADLGATQRLVLTATYMV